MSSLSAFFADDYDRETLFMPSIAIILTPLIVAALLGLNVSLIFGFAVAGLSISAVFLWLASYTIRDAGKALEKDMYGIYLPTTRCLRLRDNNGFEVEAKRQLLEKISGVTLLNKRQEIGKPDEADQRLNHAVDIVREKMRDPVKFKLLRRELKSYGFWRNLVALKWWGFGLSLVSIVVAVVVLVTVSNNARKLPTIAVTVGVLGCLYWLIVVRRKRVTSAAERYKKQFFNSLTTLQ